MPRLGFLTSSETPSLGKCRSLSTQNRHAVVHGRCPFRQRSNLGLDPGSGRCRGIVAVCFWREKSGLDFAKSQVVEILFVVLDYGIGALNLI